MKKEIKSTLQLEDFNLRQKIVDLFFDESQGIVSDEDIYKAVKENVEHFGIMCENEGNRIEQEREWINDFIQEIERMQSLYHKGHITNAERTRDLLAERLDDIMHLPSKP
jgi:Fe2+ or Zn2+ uptake regulation protein